MAKQRNKRKSEPANPGIFVEFDNWRPIDGNVELYYRSQFGMAAAGKTISSTNNRKEKIEDEEGEISHIENKEEVYQKEKRIQRDVIHIIQHVIEDLLGWTPQEAAEKMTIPLWNKLGLDNYTKALLRKDDNPNIEEKQPRYLLSFVYKKELPYDDDAQIAFLSSSLSQRPAKTLNFNPVLNDRDVIYFENNFISTHFDLSSVSKLYHDFSNAAKIRSELRSSPGMLKYVTQCIYPVELLHECLLYREFTAVKERKSTMPEFETDNFLYHAIYVKNLIDYRLKKYKRKKLAETLQK